MMFSFAGTMAIVLDQMGINGWMAVAIGSVVQGICMVVFPAIAQPYTRKILKTDEVAFGFWGSSLIVFSGFVGRLVRKKNRDEETDTWEKVKVSNKLDFLKDMSILMSIVMIVVYIFTALMAGTEVVSELAELIDAGIDSLKIEGRMKTALYVATVARTYRKAIDDYKKDPKLYEQNMPWYKDFSSLPIYSFCPGTSAFLPGFSTISPVGSGSSVRFTRFVAIPISRFIGLSTTMVERTLPSPFSDTFPDAPRISS